MTVALVQDASDNGSGSTSLTVTLSGTTGGNCLVACIQAFTSSGSSPVVQSVALGATSDTWTQVATVSPTVFANDYIYIDPGCSGGQTSVVITINSTTGPAIQAYVYEFSGIASSSALDQSTTSSGAGTSWTSGTSGATSQADEAWVGFTAFNGAAAYTITPAGSWTNLAQVNTNAGFHLGCRSGYQVNPAIGTVTYNGTYAASVTAWGSLAVSLQGGSAAAAGSVLLTYF